MVEKKLSDKRVTVAVQPVSTSKTLWLAAATIVVGVATWFGLTTSDQWTPERTDAVVGGVLVAVGAINAIIRTWFTSGPVLVNGALPALPEKEL